MKLNSETSVQITYYKDRILLSRDSIYFKNGKIDRKELMKANRKEVYNGFMSDSTARKVKRIINSWSKSIEFYNKGLMSKSLKPDRQLVCATLTLSDDQIHDDKYIKRQMLNRFILKLQKDYNVINYLWKAEKMLNCRIHFHVIIDKYVSKTDIQKEWNKIQKENGYLDNYMNKYKKVNAPSTHIRQADKNSNPEDYLCKYLSKKEKEKLDNNNKISGRIWGCSDSIRNLKVYNSGENETVISELYKESNKGRIKVIKDEFFEMYIVDTDEFLKNKCKVEFENYENYYLSLYRCLYDKQYTCQNVDMVLSQVVTKIIKHREKWIQQSLKGLEICDSHTNH